MKELDAYYSEQIALSQPASGYVTEEEEAYMDDYNDDDLDETEKLNALHQSPLPNDDDDRQKSTEQDVIDVMDDLMRIRGDVNGDGDGGDGDEETETTSND
eukprot:366006_1